MQAWKALNNLTRRQLIKLLEEAPKTTGELCGHFTLSRFAIMQHLRVLESAGLLHVERRGRYRYNHLNREQLAAFRQQLAEETAAPASGEPHAEMRRQRSPGSLAQFVEQPFIEQVYVYRSSVSGLFTALTVHLSEWWRNQGSTVMLEPRLGGRLWMQFDTSGSGVLFGTVDILRRDELLGIMGTMGTDHAVSIIRFRLAAVAENDGAELRLQQQFVGRVDVTTLEAFRNSWQELLGIYLRLFLEHAVD